MGVLAMLVVIIWVIKMQLLLLVVSCHMHALVARRVAVNTPASAKTELLHDQNALPVC